jgi:CheY-like chemotaxis protein
VTLYPAECFVPTILVADDNSNIQKMVTLALKDQGIDVVAVGNGEAAVKKLPALLPDLVLADIFMPVRNGYEVCEFVKGDERFAHIPVVLLVGAFDPLDEKEVERVHADGVLKKPFVPPDPLISMVKSMLQRGAQAAAGAAAGTAPARSSLLVAGATAPPGGQLEETQRLTELEIQDAARRSTQAPPPRPAVAAEIEPEQEMFAPTPDRVTMDQDHMPLAFGDMLDSEQKDTSDEESEETPKGRSFEASSVSDIEIHAGPEAQVSPAVEEEESHAEEEAEDHWGGIKEEMKKPSPPEPPIPVSFGPSEPVEIITEETEKSSGMEIPRVPDLVSSASEWDSSPPPSSAREVSVEPEAEIEVEPPHWTAPAPPPAAPAARIEDTQEVEPFVVSAETPSRRSYASAPPPAMEEPPAMRATAEAAKAGADDETQHFRAPLVESARHEAPATPVAPPAGASTFKAVWDRLEEIAVAGAAVGGVSHAVPHASEAPHVAEPPIAQEASVFHGPQVSMVSEPVRAEARGTAAPAAAANLVDEVTRKVLAQLHPEFMEQITRELVRPIIEAIVRRELDKK